MLDPGRYFAEAIYFLQHALAQILWSINRALLGIAIIAESINAWLTDNVGYFVQLLVNGLSAPLGGILILALSALGFWYAFNNIVATEKWIDPSKLITYGFLALFFFSSPLIAIDMLEELRRSLAVGIDASLIESATGTLFDTTMDGTDEGLDQSIPDANGDNLLTSFDLVAAFMSVVNLNELDSNEFPIDFETAYFPFGDPANINLSDEADRQVAQALANDGIERLLFALVATPTAIAEHGLRLALTSVAMLLYLGIPIALLLAFFVYTQAYLSAYIRQFINLLVETFLSVIIVTIAVSLLTAAAVQGIGLYIGASIIAFFVILWRILSALKLAGAAFNLFGGGQLTGGYGPAVATQTLTRTATGVAGMAATALTGGAALALGGAALGAATALSADEAADGRLLGSDPAKSDRRVRQLQTVAGYSLGRNTAARRVVEGAHEIRTLARTFNNGGDDAAATPQSADTLDYLRAGASMSTFGSSPWLAMRLSPSLRSAMDTIGGPARASGHPLGGVAYDAAGAPVGALGDSDAAGAPSLADLAAQFSALNQTLSTLTTELIAGQARAAGAHDGVRPLGGEPPASSGYFTTYTAASDRDAPLPPVRGRQIRLDGQSPARVEALASTLTALESADSETRRVARRTLTLYVGADRAQTLDDAVTSLGATAVQSAVRDMSAHARALRGDGANDADILAQFQTEQIVDAVPPNVHHAVADLVLLPQRQLSDHELAHAIGTQVERGHRSVADVQDALGSPVGFGGHTGTIRGVIDAAAQLELSADELTRTAAAISRGQAQAATEALVGQGHDRHAVAALTSNLRALPRLLIMPQSTGPQPETTDTGGTDATN